MPSAMNESLIGTVPAGWDREGWMAYLRMKADKCRRNRPELAQFYERWADSLCDPERDGD